MTNTEKQSSEKKHLRDIMTRTALSWMENGVIFHFFPADTVTSNYHFMQASLGNTEFYRKVNYKGIIQGPVQNVQHFPWSCAKRIS